MPTFESTDGPRPDPARGRLGVLIDDHWWWTRREIGDALEVGADAVRKWGQAGEFPNAIPAPGDATGTVLIPHSDLIAAGRIPPTMSPGEFAAQIQIKREGNELAQLRVAVTLADGRIRQAQAAELYWRDEATRLQRLLDDAQHALVELATTLHAPPQPTTEAATPDTLGDGGA